MSIDYKVWTIPHFPVSMQIFYVPGAAAQGGFTSGGARIMSPEPGGFSVMEIKPALCVEEWAGPLASWLISKSNGQILRTRFAPTPQVASMRVFAGGERWDGGDLATRYTADALQGNNIVTVDVSHIGQILRAGHVIGHAYDAYLIDDITYNNDSTATLLVTPPLRRNITLLDVALLRPWFTGAIMNGGEFKSTYDASMAGHIQLENIVLNEVIV